MIAERAVAHRARRCASTRQRSSRVAGAGRARAAAGSPLQLALRERARRNIRVHNAREHNLKNIDVEIPRDRFTVITGVSGSGKSTLAFDILFAEGQRRYLESLNAYARQFVQPASRPDVDAIFGIPPTVAIEQRTSRGGRKSTVAHADRDLPLPAPALREARHAVLPGLRRADRAAERGRDRGAAPARLPRPAHRAARAAGRQPQGLLHRPREVGARQGLHAPARRRRVPADRASGRGSTASRSTPSSCRSPTCGRARERARAARGARHARSTSARASCTC